MQVEGPDSTQEIPVMDGNATSYEVSDLRPYTTYTFSVSAMTEAGTGPPIIVSSAPQGGESIYRIVSNLTDISNYPDTISNYLFTSNYTGQSTKYEF